jgi:hypothetical protein
MIGIWTVKFEILPVPVRRTRVVGAKIRFGAGAGKILNFNRPDPEKIILNAQIVKILPAPLHERII